MNKKLNKEERFSPPPVGGISLLAAFAVLCLTVFALLSLVMVTAQKRLSEASFLTVEGYYAADCEALEILAKLREGEIPEGVTCNDDVYSYECPISGAQTLKVEVKLAEKDYEILRWQAQTEEDEIDETNLFLWDGEF